MKKKTITPAQQKQLDALQEQVRHAESHGNFNTAHHAMLARLKAELGLIPNGKTEEKEDEVTHGESNS